MFDKIKSKLSANTYKLYVIIVFTTVAVILVLISSRLSYFFIKNLYLEQLDEHVKSLSYYIGKPVDNVYLSSLDFGEPTVSVKNYFNRYFSENLIYEEEAFIFDFKSNVLIHSDQDKITPFSDKRISLNKTEIDALDIGNTAASLPFKGNDEKWYMWGFYRLNQNYCLAVKVSASKLERVEEFSIFFWYVGLAGIFVTILAGWYTANKISKPVKSLVDFSSKIGKGELNVILEGKTIGELKILFDAMDKMRNGLMKTQKEKEEMLAQIAHEIRNPLGGIELMASLLKEDMLKENKNSEYINKIIKETATLKNLITSYLNFSRPVSANQEWFSLEEIFSDVSTMFAKKLKEKKAEVIFENSLDKIRFDKNHLRNIIVNLISNSMDSIGGSGRIKVSTETTDGKWKINVIDNGKGIPGEWKDKLFTPFFTTKKNGNGLGLAISKKLCEENNASLILEYSNFDETKFSIVKTIEHE